MNPPHSCRRATAVALLLCTGTVLPAATFTVNKITDSGSGSLRTALEQANANTNPGPHTIMFSISGPAGVKTINVTNALPSITNSVIIDGWSQVGGSYSGPPVIEISGNSPVFSEYCFRFFSGTNTVRGLIINKFPYGGIALVGQGSNTIQGNYIGTDPTGMAAKPGPGNDDEDGIVIVRSANNLIGGTNSSHRNVISGNRGNGIMVLSSNAHHNIIQGNYIGVNAAGTGAVSNWLSGITINALEDSIDDYASDNLIGGSDPGARNIISGNLGPGIEIFAAEDHETLGPMRNRILGNYIGTDKDGLQAIPNLLGGIWISNATANVIGGFSVAERNLISGNFLDGVVLEAGSRSNIVRGNFIGTDVTGQGSISNLVGVSMFASSNNFIGVVGSPNVISGNSVDGIQISQGSRSNQVTGNVIGMSADLLRKVPNGRHGVAISGSTNNFILGISNSFNLIAGNAENGVFIGRGQANSESVSNLVRGNVISTNGLDGVHIDGASGNQVLGNVLGGIFFADGRPILGNGRHGIAIFDSTNNTIGGTEPLTYNNISGNRSNGVFIGKGSLGTGSCSNFVTANQIGNDLMGNGGAGVFVQGSGNQIGGFEAGEGNHIQFNGSNLVWHGHGVVIESGTNNLIVGNDFKNNSGRGIDLGNDSFTVNDIRDPDTGANELQNYPVVTRVAFHLPQGLQEITWTLNSQPLRYYHIEVFGNTEPDPSGFGEGEERLTTRLVLTDANGMAVFTTPLPYAAEFISATATDVQDRNTSEFSPVDTDGDAVADAWETGGIDFDEDGTFDLELGSNPLHKDIFVEIDAMSGRAPNMNNLSRVNAGSKFGGVDVVLDLATPIDGFWGAPNSKVQNPDRDDGILVHLELGDTNLPLISWSALSFTDVWGAFGVLKTNFFGTAEQRNNPKALAAKSLIYRYCIFADEVSDAGGAAFVGANNFYITLGNNSSHSTFDYVPTSFMHELGHCLGLLHGGVDDVNFKPNYHSIMNYAWEGSGSRNSPWRLDFSREEFARLDESDLNETVGIGASSAHAGHMVAVGPLGDGLQWIPEVGPYDWNNNSNIDFHVTRDIDFLSGSDPSPGGVLVPSEDWSKLRYYFLDNQFSTVIGLNIGPPAVPTSSLTNDLDPAVLKAFEELGTDVGFIQFSEQFYSVSETGGVAIVTVRRPHEMAADVSVSFTRINGTAVSGSDYAGTNGVLTFLGDETVKSFTIPILNDNIAEGSETIRLVLSNPTGGATLGPRTEVLLIIADDDSPQSFMVSNTNNSGAGSLRQAILDANAAPGRATLSFNIPGGGGLTISPSSALPAITNAITIDGATQPGYAGVPIIELNGTNAGAGSDGLRITAGNCTVRGLVINRFSGSGINLFSGNQNLIEGCYIGLSRLGTLDQGNSGSGINVQTADNLIGGTATAARNFISGNNGSGISFSAIGATNNQVLGNVIGLGVNGSDQGNSGAGVSISSSWNTIGGQAQGARNVISGNDQNGVDIIGGIENRILGNFIGTDLAGTAARGNGANGIKLSTLRQIIGGTTPSTGNVISGNAQRGIELAGASFTTILANRIGTDASGVSPLPNQTGGVLFRFNAQNNQLGWPTGAVVSVGQPYPANTIAFNNGPGIAFESGGASNDVIRGNSIFSHTAVGFGIDLAGQGNRNQNAPVLTSASNSPSGTVILGSLNSRPNTTFTIDFYASLAPGMSGFGEGQAWIGGVKVTTDGSGNAAFTTNSGAIYLAGRYITATATDPAGNTSQFSSAIFSDTIYAGKTFTVVNTNDSGAGSFRQAILDANANVSASDTIAFDIPGSGVRTIRPLSPLPTISDSVVIDGYTQPGASPNTAATGHNGVLRIELDGSVAGATHGLRLEAGNSIVRGLVINRFAAGANFSDLPGGIMLSGVGGHRVEGCFIGTDAAGFVDRGNAYRGVVIYRSSTNVIGGTVPAARNVISGNDPGGSVVSGEAVLLYGDSVLQFSGNRIEGNLLGTAANGVSALGNSGAAIRFGQAVTNTTIGGTISGAGNVIAFNASADSPQDACGVSDPLAFGARGVAVLGNSIHSNNGPGIKGDLVNSSDGRGNFPFLSSALSTNGITAIQGRVHSVSNALHRIEFFANDTVDPGGHGEGKTFLGATATLTDSNGFAAFNVQLPVTVSNTQFVTATATDDRSNTSEFSPRLRVNDVLTNVIVVNSINDVDDGVANTNHTSLREAIFAANNHLGPDTIRFAIGTGARTIPLTNALPPLMDSGTTIDATTQPGFTTAPLIYLDGQLLTPTGFRVYAPSNTIRGFAINRFGYGIYGDALFASPFGGFNVIEGNYLGTDLNGGSTGVQEYGIYFTSSFLPVGFSGNRIGGPTSAARNVISGNKRAGVFAFGSASNTFLGNFIGTDRTGTNALANGIGPQPTGGLFLQRCQGSVIGGSAPGMGNLISGNSSLFNMQTFLWDDCSGSVVQGNYVGTDVLGRTNLGNSLIAIDVTGSGQILIKSNLLAGGGLISFEVYGSLSLRSPSNRVEGNFIGTDATGTRAFGLPGAVVIGSDGIGNVIGGTNATSRNLISGGGYGVRIIGRSNIVQGNFIGTQINGVGPLGNGFDGVLVQGSFNQIGGIGAGAGNIIAFNAGKGVFVSAGTNNALLGNSIFSNTSLGIDLGPDGLTTNDPGDLDSGANQLQNFPILSAGRNIGSATLIEGTLNSRSNTAYRIELFSNTNCGSSSQGRVFVNALTATTDASGSAAFAFQHPAPIPAGQVITATATDPNNNTSEFSPCTTVFNDTNYVVLSFSLSVPYTLSWPQSVVGFLLERSTNLEPPVVWQVISNGITTNGGNRVFVVTNNVDVPTLFFRLRKP